MYFEYSKISLCTSYYFSSDVVGFFSFLVYFCLFAFTVLNHLKLKRLKEEISLSCKSPGHLWQVGSDQKTGSFSVKLCHVHHLTSKSISKVQPAEQGKGSYSSYWSELLSCKGSCKNDFSQRPGLKESAKS